MNCFNGSWEWAQPKIVGEVMSLALQIKGNMYAPNEWFNDKLNELKECIFEVK